MGISRDTGYSASIESYVIVGKQRLGLAKTNGVSFLLADEPAIAVPPGTAADMFIIVDGKTGRKSIELLDGITPGESRVRYAHTVPF